MDQQAAVIARRATSSACPPIPGRQNTGGWTMRKTVIIGTIAALLGFAALAQAGDQPRSELPNGSQTTGMAADDGRGDKDDRDVRKDQSRQRHDVTDDQRHEAQDDGDDRDDVAERRNQR
jgi:hypothetical protein